MIKKYPLLVNNSPNMKLRMEEYKVLYYCNGLNDINTIKEKTNMSNLKVLMTIKKFEKKGKMRIKHMISQNS